MGTLSHHFGKPFGYKGNPATCRWCGDTLRHKRVMAGDSDRGDPTYRDEGGWATVRAARSGGYQDGLFCGLRCGYQWAVRALSRQ